MDIKERLSGKDDSIYSDKQKQEFPEDFEPNQKEIDKAGDLNLKEFVAKKKTRDKEKEALKAKKPVEPEPVERIEEEIPKQPQIEEQPKLEQQSNFTKSLTIYMTPDKVEQTKEALTGAIQGGYGVVMQAGVQITPQNVEKVKSVLKYFADNGYLVVISGEIVEPVFDESGK